MKGSLRPPRHPGLQADAARQRRSGLTALRTPEGEPMPPNTLAELRRDMARLRFVKEQIKQIEAARLRAAGSRRPSKDPHAMVRLLARVMGSASRRRTCWCTRCFSRDLRDRRAVARYAGLTGSPDESGKQAAGEGARQGGQRAGASRHDPTGLALPARSRRTAPWRNGTGRAPRRRGETRKTMIVALARKLLIALWRLVTTGEVPRGRRPASGDVSGSGKEQQAPTVSAPARRRCGGLPMTIRGGGDPQPSMAFSAAL